MVGTTVVDLLDSYRLKAFRTARNYARQGNVPVSFQGFKVLARVQGTEPEPYQVSLSLTRLAMSSGVM